MSQEQLQEAISKYLQSSCGLSLQESEEKGRFIVTSKQIHAGDIVLRSEPYVAVPLPDNMSSICSNCFKHTSEVESGKMLRCGGCKGVWYCSAACQRKDWEIDLSLPSGGHKYECKSLQKVYPYNPTQTLRLVARTLRIRNLQLQKGQLCYVDFLRSHRQDCSQEKLETYGQMALLLTEFMHKDELSDMSASDIIDMFCKMACNNFNTADAEIRFNGVGLYPTCALLNHSCDPNCVGVFRGKSLYIRAIQDIPPGTEITISYLEVGHPTEVRQTEIQNSFFFTCKCNRCQDTTKDKYMTAKKCQVVNCPGILYQSDNNSLVCQKCNAVYSSETIQASIMESNALYQKAHKAKTEDRIFDARYLYDQCATLRLSIFCKYHTDVLSVATEIMAMSIDDSDWKRAKKYCKLTVQIYRYIYKSNWPLLGLQLFMLGRIYWYLRFTAKALVSFKEALNILTITHGSDSKLVNDLVNLTKEAEAEYDWLRQAKTIRL